MSTKYLIPRHDFFTPQGWELLRPLIEALPDDGGCVAFVLDAQPDARNFLTVHIATFTGKQRQATRKAVLKAGGQTV